jgi:hypothetical protein
MLSPHDDPVRQVSAAAHDQAMALKLYLEESLFAQQQESCQR